MISSWILTIFLVRYNTGIDVTPVRYETLIACRQAAEANKAALNAVISNTEYHLIQTCTPSN